MLEQRYADYLRSTLDGIDRAGLHKRERILASPQRARIALQTGQPVLNLCANNYLGLANHPEVIAAAHAALDRYHYARL